MYRIAALIGFAAGTLAVLVGFVRMLSQTEVRATPRSAREPDDAELRWMLREVDAAHDRTRRFELVHGRHPTQLEELRMQRRALLAMGVPESALEPLLDPELS